MEVIKINNLYVCGVDNLIQSFTFKSIDLNMGLQEKTEADKYRRRSYISLPKGVKKIKIENLTIIHGKYHGHVQFVSLGTDMEIEVEICDFETSENNIEFNVSDMDLDNIYIILYCDDYRYSDGPGLSGEYDVVVGDLLGATITNMTLEF